MLTGMGHAEHNLLVTSYLRRHVPKPGYAACNGFVQAEKTTAHPMLAMVANCEQPLTTRYSRRLITLQKVQPYNAELEQQTLLSEQLLR
jgi:hypothetical protein